MEEMIWKDAAEQFTSVACSFLGLSAQSHLAVCVSAGLAALPSLLKFKRLPSTVLQAAASRSQEAPSSSPSSSPSPSSSSSPSPHNMDSLSMNRNGNGRSPSTPPSTTRVAEVQVPNLGKEFQFHSVFTCPINLQMSTKDNPPMLLPCGHVLSQNAVTNLGKANLRSRLKCPYCPNEFREADCQVVYF